MRQINRYLVLAMLLVAASACSRAAGLFGRDPKVSSEEAVYSALLDGLYPNPKVQLLVLSDHTAPLPPTRRSMSSWLREPSQLRSQTFADFRAKNAAPQELPAKPSARMKVKTLSEDDVRQLSSATAVQWREFFKENPTAPGLISLSRAGFNQDSTQAFVFVRVDCGARCRDGLAVVMTRPRDGGWKLKERHLLERKR